MAAVGILPPSISHRYTTRPTCRPHFMYRPTTRSQTRNEQAAVAWQERERRIAERGDLVGLLVRDFRGCTSLAGTSIEEFRSRLRFELVNAISTAEEQGVPAEQQQALAGGIISDGMRRIDQCRRSMLHAFEAHDRFLAGSGAPGARLDAQECARRLHHAVSQDIGSGIARYVDQDQSFFAAAVLLMILELVVKAQGTPRQTLYHCLIREPDEEFSGLFVVEHVNEFTEDLLMKLISQFKRILTLFDSMPPTDLPRTNIVTVLRSQYELLRRKSGAAGDGDSDGEEEEEEDEDDEDEDDDEDDIMSE